MQHTTCGLTVNNLDQKAVARGAAFGAVHPHALATGARELVRIHGACMCEHSMCDINIRHQPRLAMTACRQQQCMVVLQWCPNNPSTPSPYMRSHWGSAGRRAEGRGRAG